MFDSHLSETRPRTDPSRGAQVIALPAARLAARDPVAVRLEAYWSDLARKAGGVPRRADIDPRAIDTGLSDIFLIERIAPGLARFRVAGTGLSELMNMDVRGMPLSTFLLPADREEFAAALTALFERPAKLRLGLGGAPGPGQPRLTGRMLLLPLCDDAGAVGRAIGCLVTSGTAGRTPRRFRLTGTRIEPVDEIGATGLPPYETPVAEPPVPESPLTDTAASTAASDISEPRQRRPRRATGRPHLRLVKTD